MKKILTLFVIAFVSSMALTAQNSNLIFFNQDGDRFQVVLNGILQNADYQTNVRIPDVPMGSYKAKVIFENQKLPELDKTIYLTPENGPQEISFNIKKNKKEEYVMRVLSMVPIAQAPPAPPTQTVVHYTTVPAQPTQVVVSETTTTVTETSTGVSDNVNVGMNVGGVGMNVNVNVNDNMGGVNSTTTTTSTSTTVVSSSTHTSTGVSTTEPSLEIVSDPVYVNEPTHYNMPGYSGPIGCPWPMSETDYQSALNSINAKSFEDSKLTVAKQITNSNCLTSAQVKGIMQTFDFEDSRLEYAKYAYGRTYDIGNYYKVNDAFDFETSIEELNNHISR